MSHEPCQESSGLSSTESFHKHASMLSKNLRRAARARGRGQKRQIEAQHAAVRDAAPERACQAMRSQELASRRFAERAHGPPRGVEQYSASRGDLTELEASRSIAPSSVVSRADGEASAARQMLCARMGFWPFVRRPPSGVCETLVRGQDWGTSSVSRCVLRFHRRCLKSGPIIAVTEILTRCSYCLLYTSPSPRDVEESRMPSSA